MKRPTEPARIEERDADHCRRDARAEGRRAYQSFAPRRTIEQEMKHERRRTSGRLGRTSTAHAAMTPVRTALRRAPQALLPPPPSRARRWGRPSWARAIERARSGSRTRTGRPAPLLRARRVVVPARTWSRRSGPQTRGRPGTDRETRRPPTRAPSSSAGPVNRLGRWPCRRVRTCSRAAQARSRGMATAAKHPAEWAAAADRTASRTPR